MEMTEKQKRFCDEYLIDLNATQACIRAGYSKKYAGTNADKLLKNTKIKEYLDDRMKEKESRLIATQDEVLQELTKIVRGESLDESFSQDEFGDVKIIRKKNQANIIKALELLCKRYGLLNNNVNVAGDVSITFVEDLDD